MKNNATTIRNGIIACLFLAGVSLAFLPYGQNGQDSREMEKTGLFEEAWARHSSGKAFISWKVKGDTESGLFIVERSSFASSGFQPIGAKICLGTDVKAPVRYSYTDDKPLAGSNWYRIVKISDSGDYSISRSFMVDVSLGLPRAMHMISQ